jgi:hypothetical protein
LIPAQKLAQWHKQRQRGAQRHTRSLHLIFEERRTMEMQPASQSGPRKRYGLFVLAILVLLSGGVALVMGSNSFAAVACILSVYLVRISNVYTQAASTVISDQGPDSRATKRPRPLMWIFGVALLAAQGISFLSLHRGALGGHQEILPVYIFAGIALACTLFWSYLLSRISS